MLIIVMNAMNAISLNYVERLYSIKALMTKGSNIHLNLLTDGTGIIFNLTGPVNNLIN